MTGGCETLLPVFSVIVWKACIGRYSGNLCILQECCDTFFCTLHINLSNEYYTKKQGKNPAVFFPDGWCYAINNYKLYEKLIFVLIMRVMIGW